MCFTLITLKIFKKKFKHLDIVKKPAMTTTRKLSKSLMISATALNAVLYAIGALATAYIESPWGHGQFRPAIVIPSLFAIIFGPWVGGIGAAIGTLLADSIKHGYIYPPSLIAAVPANFIAFYLFGRVLEKRFTWTRFIWASILSLVIGNLICAILLVAYYTYVIPIFLPQFFIPLCVGLTSWWYITMIPFQLLVTPILIKAVVRAFPSIVPQDVIEASLRKEMPTMHFAIALLVPGLIMFSFGIATILDPNIALSMVGVLRKAYLIASLIQVMFIATGLGSTILGASLMVISKLRKI